MEFHENPSDRKRDSREGNFSSSTVPFISELYRPDLKVMGDRVLNVKFQENPLKRRRDTDENIFFYSSSVVPFIIDLLRTNIHVCRPWWRIAKYGVSRNRFNERRRTADYLGR